MTSFILIWMRIIRRPKATGCQGVWLFVCHPIIHLVLSLASGNCCNQDRAEEWSTNSCGTNSSLVLSTNGGKRHTLQGGENEMGIDGDWYGLGKSQGGDMFLGVKTCKYHLPGHSAFMLKTSHLTSWLTHPVAKKLSSLANWINIPNLGPVEYSNQNDLKLKPSSS